MNILVHGTILGYGGIAHHTREFTKSLSRHHNVKIRNFNLVDLEDWEGYTGPDILKNAKHLDDIHHKLLYQQTLYNSNGELTDYPLSGYDSSFVPDIHIIMAEVNHYYHYQLYDKPIIIYFPWETTNVLPKFLERLISADYLWVPSEWQKQMLIDNGVESNKISVVHEGVDPKKYYPIKRNNDKLTFLHIGTWGYRKSSYEIIKTFIDNFGDNNDIELRISINNKLDYQEGPIETFERYGLSLKNNIKILGTLSEEDYFKEIKNADLYISCSRGEGWNLPVMQAIACGVPTIYSKCGGQLEFDKHNVGIGINILHENPAKRSIIINKHPYSWESLPAYQPNNLYEPDYLQLENEIKLFYKSYKENKNSEYNKKAIRDSKIIREVFDWDQIVKNSNRILESYKNQSMSNIYYLIHSQSFGDTLAATPTLRYLSKSHRNKINVVTHNKSIFKNNPYVSSLLSFDEYNKILIDDIIKYESFTYAGRKDNNGIEKKFSHIDTRQLHSMDLGFQLLPEDMSYDFYPDPLSLDIELPQKYVVLHVTTNWANRTWDYKNWRNLIKWLKGNQIFTVLIGSGYKEELHNSYSDKPLDKECPMFDDYYGLDLTNKGTMSDMWWVINGSQCLVTMDSGPLHLAGTTDVNIIQMGSAINPKFRAPYRRGNQEYKYHYLGGTCNLFCNSNLYYNVKEWGDINSVPPQPNCAENKATFECHPKCDDVIDKIKEILNLNQQVKNNLTPESNILLSTKKDKKIKFGIYTSFYNSEKFIHTAFKNIENIKYENFEWHITDDFSSDNTKDILLETIEKSPIKDKIKFYEQTEKKEMYWKANLFFDDTFEWIILIDSDDLVDPEFLNIYNLFLQDRDDLSLVSSDCHKIYEDNGRLHSISYILNDDKISTKIDRYHPSCDYLNNISYSCFGLLRGFKKSKVGDFEIKNNLACAEDSYHVFWSNSFGKYLHIPRPLYIWNLRDDSESHSAGLKPNFNDNFQISLDKLKESDYGVDTLFNDVYIESCSLASYDIGGLKNKKVSLWSRPLSDNQKEKLQLLYSDSNLLFNDENCDVNVFCLNFFSSGELDSILNRIFKDKVLLYYQNQKYHSNNSEKDVELTKQLNYYKNVIDKHMSYSWWTYIRHFIIKNNNNE